MNDTKDNSTTSIEVAGEVIEIKRVKMRDLTEVTRAFQPFVKEFERIVKANNSIANSDLLALVGNFADETVMLATVLTDKPGEFYRELEPLDFLKVMQALVSHSGDFFLTQIFTPLLSLGEQLSTLGMTAYSNSQK